MAKIAVHEMGRRIFSIGQNRYARSVAEHLTHPGTSDHEKPDKPEESRKGKGENPQNPLNAPKRPEIIKAERQAHVSLLVSFREVINTVVASRGDKASHRTSASYTLAEKSHAVRSP